MSVHHLASVQYNAGASPLYRNPAPNLTSTSQSCIVVLTLGDAAGKYTVPILWDKKTGSIVNNESADIVRIFNERFNSVATNVSAGPAWRRTGSMSVLAVHLQSHTAKSQFSLQAMPCAQAEYQQRPKSDAVIICSQTRICIQRSFTSSSNWSCIPVQYNESQRFMHND